MSLSRTQASILVSGGSGFLGWHLARALARSGEEVVATSRDGTGLPDGVRPLALELGDGGLAGAERIRELRPAAVCHLAALADADRCAREPALAQTINAAATGALARAAAGVGAFFLYSSTDLVFDGTAAPYAEGDPPRPLGPYMASKQAGEQAVLAASPAHLVVRVALLYGRAASARHSCFAEVLVRRLRAGEPVDLFHDQIRTPVQVEDAVELLQALLARRPAGIVHLGGPERISRLDHGLAIARACGLPETLCRPASMFGRPGLAPRPPDVSLRTDRLRALVGRSALGLAEGCRRMAEDREQGTENTNENEE